MKHLQSSWRSLLPPGASTPARSSAASTPCSRPSRRMLPARAAISEASKNGSAASTPPSKFDYDLVIVGAGVGGHGAALHAVEQGLKVAVVEGHDIGGTCVNRGCVPSKALLAAAGQLRTLKSEHHMKALGIQLPPGDVGFDRQKARAGHMGQNALATGH